MPEADTALSPEQHKVNDCASEQELSRLLQTFADHEDDFYILLSLEWRSSIAAATFAILGYYTSNTAKNGAAVFEV